MYKIEVIPQNSAQLPTTASFRSKDDCQKWLKTYNGCLSTFMVVTKLGAFRGVKRLGYERITWRHLTADKQNTVWVIAWSQSAFVAGPLVSVQKKHGVYFYDPDEKAIRTVTHVNVMALYDGRKAAVAALEEMTRELTKLRARGAGMNYCVTDVMNRVGDQFKGMSLKEWSSPK